MEIRKIENKLEIQRALELIWETFLQFEAPDYSEEGIKSFKNFIDDEAMVNTPVSYTHLDVYKRQVCGCSGQGR